MRFYLTQFAALATVHIFTSAVIATTISETASDMVPSLASLNPTSSSLTESSHLLLASASTTCIDEVKTASSAVSSPSMHVISSDVSSPPWSDSEPTSSTLVTPLCGSFDSPATVIHTCTVTETCTQTYTQYSEPTDSSSSKETKSQCGDHACRKPDFTSTTSTYTDCNGYNWTSITDFVPNSTHAKDIQAMEAYSNGVSALSFSPALLGAMATLATTAVVFATAI
ncbi:hypothetical protein M011DRAFT_475526 [Sporormia fimetaria CBS 119925]|uniref:Uncharacterized protein n=1 Tax=Sporormia fimetaria CBS 119925 TaxID=1340428 RepID=A0A6A6VGZ5_9PLEO|nr:hypothetical protein M011DRAFT_475526 [Sporormia fimetaria CBS 119925]